MDVPWKVILAFVGVFIAGAVFGGVFTLGVSVRRFPNVPRQPLMVDRSAAQYSAVTQPKSKAAGPQLPKSGLMPARSNPITPILMTQFTRKLTGLSAPQKESLRTILGRAGEDYHRLRQQNLADVARVTDRMYTDVSGVLNAEQRSELEQMRKRVEERLQADRRKRAEAAAAEAAARATNAAAAKARAGKSDAKRGIAK
jgi:hypothetical protein